MWRRRRTAKGLAVEAPVGYLPPARPAHPRALRLLANLLIAFGLLALAEVTVTAVWQDPITAIYTTLRQESLRGDLAKLAARGPSAQTAALLAVTNSTKERIALLASELEGRLPAGAAAGEIAIPAIGIRFAGAGSLTAIAGHRTTCLAPFRHIDRLRPGDPIFIAMPYGRFEYVVVGRRTVPPEDVAAATAPPAGVNLVLSSCNPPFSAAERILVYAHLRSVTPRGQALAFQRSLAARQAPASPLGRLLGLPPAAPASPAFPSSKPRSRTTVRSGRRKRTSGWPPTNLPTGVSETPSSAKARRALSTRSPGNAHKSS